MLFLYFRLWANFAWIRKLPSLQQVGSLDASLAPVHLHLLPLELLLRDLLLLWLRGGGRLVEGLLPLHQAQLDVARGRHVRVDASVSAVGAAAHVRGAVHLDVVDDQVVGVKALVLGVALGVLEQVQQELGGLLGPAALGGAVDLGLKNKRNGLVQILLKLNKSLKKTLFGFQKEGSNRKVSPRLSKTVIYFCFFITLYHSID